MIRTAELFSQEGLSGLLKELLQVEYPWEALALLDQFGSTVEPSRVAAGRVHPTAVIEGALHLEEGAEVGPHAYISGPAYLSRGAKVGHGARVRGPVVLGERALVMHASEVKRSLLLDDAHAPHFNYVGDSVIGRGVNLGAGTKLANFTAFATEVNVAGQPTGLRKLGSALGDGVSIGCNAVLAPGTIVGKRTVIYALASVRGVVPADTVVKYSPELAQAVRR